MTVAQNSNLPANTEDFETGLEDFGIEDAVVPRLTIVHKDAEFRDSLTGMTFSKLNVIILGLVKQRILWHQTVDEGDVPMCKSPDHKTGFPNVSEDTKKDKRFPWEKSGFRPEDFPPDENGLIALPCDGCALKEWGSHPDGKRPYCSEQFTLPVLYDPYENDGWVPAILTLQKTGIKPVRSYLTGFARGDNPAFTAVTEISLNLQHRGQTDYSVPSFKRIGDTDSDNWREYSASFRTLKNFLQAAPKAAEDVDGDTPAESAPAAKQQTQQQAPPKEEPKQAEPQAPASSSSDDDDLPF